MIYFVSDLHFGHENIIHHCNRPFQSCSEMDEVMIQNWNARITPQDTVYILGDLFLSHRNPEHILSRLQGKKYLITGNHDKAWLKHLENKHPGALEAYFEDISPMICIRLEGRLLVLCHYPLLTWEEREEGSWHIFGHVHNDCRHRPEPNSFNACVELNGYCPVTLEELVENNRAFYPPRQDPIKAYLALAAEKPELFAPNDTLPLCLDEDRIRAFSCTHNRPMGLVYSNLPFYSVVADLCGAEGKEFSYARVIYPNPTNGAVAIPKSGDKFGLLRIFRHIPRTECLEFPRGFATKNLSPQDNIRKELAEEMGAVVEDIRKLGMIRADSGLSAGLADVYLAQVSQANAQIGHEGIRELLWVSEEELHSMIRSGAITDGFTLSALTLLDSSSLQNL